LIVVVQYLIEEIPTAVGDGQNECPAPQTDTSDLWLRSAAKHLVGTIKVVLVVWQITTQFASVTGTTYPSLYQEFVGAIGVLDLD
ncbi:unnamed protein product, partial [Ascophyllum nodosum]